MKQFPEKPCDICGEIYTPTGPAAKYCVRCAAVRKAAVLDRSSKKFQLRNGVRLGVGKGGNNAKGREDSQFKTGISFFIKTVKVIRDEIRYCERCGKDLKGASAFQWATHHKDHDRTNNVRSNLELLCKRCHQLEHDCADNFSKVQRLDRKIVGNSVPEAPDTIAA